jgi:hypothetical protein
MGAGSSRWPSCRGAGCTSPTATRTSQRSSRRAASSHELAPAFHQIHEDIRCLVALFLKRWCDGTLGARWEGAVADGRADGRGPRCQG